MQPKVFKYKLDFYYQQSILYLLTMIVYIGIRGTFDFAKLPTLKSDPILYIIILFVLVSLISLILNKYRDRKLIINENQLIFHRKDRQHVIPFSDIEWVYIGREKSIQIAGRSQVMIFKIKERYRLFRIRIGRYEREKELLEEIMRIAERVPKVKRPVFSLS